MSKLKRDVDAFAQRVKMSRQTSLFILVEGRINDRPFYERILRRYTRASGLGFSIRTVEDLTMDGKSSGGKSFALALLGHLEEQGVLVQNNSEGKRFIAFAVDSDFDEFSGSALRHPHLVVTESADVEAEILRVGQLVRSVSSTYGLTKDQASRAVDSKSYVFGSLAKLWLPWIALRAMSVANGSRDAARYGGVSAIHDGHFGEIDDAKEADLRASIADQVAISGRQVQVADAEARAQTRISEGAGHKLLKGRWIAKYVKHLVESRLSDQSVSTDFPPDVLVKVCLETIDFKGPWISHYTAQLDRLLSESSSN